MAEFNRKRRVGEGKWVNAKTDDNNIEVTIGYYRVPID